MASPPFYSSFTAPSSSTIPPPSPNLYGYGYSSYYNYEQQPPLPYSQPQPPPPPYTLNPHSHYHSHLAHQHQLGAHISPSAHCHGPLPISSPTIQNPYSSTHYFHHSYSPPSPNPYTSSAPYGYTSARSSENYNTYEQQPAQLDSQHVGASEISISHSPTPMASASQISFSNSTIPKASQPRLDLFVAMQESVCDIKESLLALLDAVREAERSPKQMTVNQTPTSPNLGLGAMLPCPPSYTNPSPSDLQRPNKDSFVAYDDEKTPPNSIATPFSEVTTTHFPYFSQPPHLSTAKMTKVSSAVVEHGVFHLCAAIPPVAIPPPKPPDMLRVPPQLFPLLRKQSTNYVDQIPTLDAAIVCDGELCRVALDTLSLGNDPDCGNCGDVVILNTYGADIATNLLNSLINFCATQDFPNSARLVFAEMLEQNAVLFPLYIVEPWHILEQENAKLRFGGVPIIQLSYGPRDMYLQVKSLWPHLMTNVDHSLHHLRGNIVYTTLVMYEHEPSTIELWKAVCSQLWKIFHVSDGPSRAASITVSHYFANSLVIFSHLAEACSYYLLNDSTFQLYGEDFVSITKCLFTEINLSHSLETMFTICHAYFSPVIEAWNRLVDWKMLIVWVILQVQPMLTETSEIVGLLSMLHAMTLVGGIISASTTFGHKDVMLCQNFGQENCRRWNQGEFGQEIESKLSNICAAVMRMFDGAVWFALFSQRMNTKIGQQWDPDWHLAMCSAVGTFQFKQWDPVAGKFFKSRLYNLEDKVGLEGQWNIRNNTKGSFRLNEDVGPIHNDGKPNYLLVILVIFYYICKNVVLDPSNDW